MLFLPMDKIQKLLQTRINEIERKDALTWYAHR